MVKEREAHKEQVAALEERLAKAQEAVNKAAEVEAAYAVSQASLEESFKKAEVLINENAQHRLDLLAAQSQTTALTAANEELKASLEKEKSEAIAAQVEVGAERERADQLEAYVKGTLVPKLLTATASQRWLTGRGLRLVAERVVMGDQTFLAKMATAITAAKDAGLAEGAVRGVEHGSKQGKLEDMDIHDPLAAGRLTAAYTALEVVNFPIIAQAEVAKDEPIEVVTDLLVGPGVVEPLYVPVYEPSAEVGPSMIKTFLPLQEALTREWPLDGSAAFLPPC